MTSPPPDQYDPHDQAFLRAVELLELMVAERSSEAVLFWQTVPEDELRIMSFAALSVATVVTRSLLGPVAPEYLEKLKGA